MPALAAVKTSCSRTCEWELPGSVMYSFNIGSVHPWKGHPVTGFSESEPMQGSRHTFCQNDFNFSRESIFD